MNKQILPYNEKELLLKIANGESNAFETLYELWYDKVYGTALLVSKSPEMASDVTQDVFLVVWRDRAKMTAVEKLGAFLFITTRNMVYNKLKRQDLETAYRSYILPHTEADNDTVIFLHLKELQQTVEDAVSQLPPQQQRAFRLSREQGLSHEEIALELGISQKSVKDYIVRALAFLRTYLRQSGELLAFSYIINHFF